MNNQVVVLFGSGAIGKAIVRRVASGKTILLADYNKNNLASVKKELEESGFRVETIQADLSSKDSIKAVVKKAQSLGEIKHLINAAGISPSQATPQEVLKTDLYGTSVLIEEFGKVICDGGSAVIISSQSGHRLPELGEEANKKLAMTPVEDLLNLDILQEDVITDSLYAYQYAKRQNVLRVAAESVNWQKRGARINTISPGIVMTPLALDELNGPRGEGYRKMFDSMVTKRPATPDEIGELGEFLLSDKAAFITGSDILIDGGISAQYWYGDVNEVRK